MFVGKFARISKKPLTFSPPSDIMNHMKEKAFVFDLDGTLFETSAVIHEEAEGLDAFIEFNDCEKLALESKPLPLLDFARTVANEGHEVYILTARQSIVAQTIMDLLSQYGVTAHQVYCVGDKGLEVSAYKAELLRELSLKFRTYFFDNEEPNLEAAVNCGVFLYDETRTRYN